MVSESKDTARYYQPTEGNSMQETAYEFFVALEESLSYLPNISKVYIAYNQLFQRLLNQATSMVSLNFSGSFAKTDFLLKEHHASLTMKREVNATRIRLRKQKTLSDNTLEQWCYYDFRNLTQFVSLLYKVSIPEHLSAYFPKHEPTQLPQYELIDDYVRFIVDHWDNDHVYGTADIKDGTWELKVRYANGNPYYDFDWSYLAKLFEKGSQLNLIRPRERDGVVYPELIIFEPDYLLDISTVARCFTEYADSPKVNLLKKLEPSQNTEATMLGNFAGQLLDEEIHQLPEGHDYKTSVQQFWQNNAFKLLTSNLTPDFHEEAKVQRVNIRKAINQGLSDNVGGFNPKNCIVEPSFFSEMLGLQGRIDLLQLDYKVLIEQKSGKGLWPFDGFHIPKQREEHYVQMLLYMLLIRYNFSDIYAKNNNELFAFLLYSKYTESLLPLGFSPELTFRAIKLRNELAAQELRYTHPNGMRVLETLTAELLNEKGVRGKLWDDYQSKQISNTLTPIHQASELERAYYFRFLTFIANEHILSKLGNKTKENSGFASRWHDTLEEKRQAGNIYDRLTLISPNELTEGNVSDVTLQFAEELSSELSDFRLGDTVVLYPYDIDKEPDLRKTMVLRGRIKAIDIDNIVISLNATQSDARIFLHASGAMWAIEHDFMESSDDALYRGMHAFLSAPQERRDLLMLQRAPEFDESKTLNGDYGAFNPLMTAVKQAEDLFLIIGPPGTGKTSYGLLNTLKEELSEEENSVLLLSYTNRAVDEMCSKLIEDGIDFIRLGNRLTCATEHHNYLLESRTKQCKNVKELKEMILSTRVFVATTSTKNSHLALLKLHPFTLTIIDEASQILEPHLIGILSAKNSEVSAIKKIVMIGDHKQLPAVVQQQPSVSRVDDEALNDIHLTDCRLSLFERLLRQYRADSHVVGTLHKQGRMHPEIADFPNQIFYNNELEAVGSPCDHQTITLPSTSTANNGIDQMLETRRITFLHVDAPQSSVSDKVNQAEADIIATIIERIYIKEGSDFDAIKTVGIIVPYRNQIATVRAAIDQKGIPTLHDITIDTVERYQGSQRKYIIYGITIQKKYQLEFLTNNTFTDIDGTTIDRKLNVAMTRAKEHLIMTGNATLLLHNITYKKLLTYLKRHQNYFEIAKENIETGCFNLPETKI